MSDKEDRVIAGTLHGRRGRVICVADGQPVPEGAVPINRSVVATMKTNSIKNKPLAEMWPMHGGYIISGTTWVLSAIGMYHVRQRFKLFTTARGLCYLMAPVGPTLLSGLIHSSRIVDPILDNTEPKCPMCLPLRASCINIVIGWAVPTAMTLFVASHVARLSYSHPIPPINEFRAYYKEMNKVTKKVRPIFGGTLVLAAIIPFILTRLEKNTADRASSMPLQEYEERINRLTTGGNDEEWGKADTHS